MAKAASVKAPLPGSEPERPTREEILERSGNKADYADELRGRAPEAGLGLDGLTAEIVKAYGGGATFVEGWRPAWLSEIRGKDLGQLRDGLPAFSRYYLAQNLAVDVLEDGDPRLTDAGRREALCEAHRMRYLPIREGVWPPGQAEAVIAAEGAEDDRSGAFGPTPERLAEAAAEELRRAAAARKRKSRAKKSTRVD